MEADVILTNAKLGRIAGESKNQLAHLCWENVYSFARYIGWTFWVVIGGRKSGRVTFRLYPTHWLFLNFFLNFLLDVFLTSHSKNLLFDQGILVRVFLSSSHRFKDERRSGIGKGRNWGVLKISATSFFELSITFVYMENVTRV